MKIINEEKIEKTLKIVSIFIITCFCVLLFPQARRLIIEIGEKIIGKNLNNSTYYMKALLTNSLFIIFFFGILLTLLLLKKRTIFLQNFINKYGEKIFIFASAGIVVMSIIVRIIMYIKCRSLWHDEAMLAAGIVFRNLFELLTPPLLDNQSAPVLYVITVKLICSILGYSEFSLRIISFFFFLGLLFCEILLLKKAFNFDNFKAAVAVVLTALLPQYIYYSNELKPYMGDAFFVILAFLLYFIYTQGKIRLPVLTALYILLLGFSTPVIFFMGGILINEFITAIINKNKKQIIYIVLSGSVVLVVFGLYYYWWLSPVSDFMKAYWGMPHIWQLPKIFLDVSSETDSSFIWLFTLFVFLGIFSLIKSKSKIASSAALSLVFVFLASLMGYWPLTGRLWLFLPVIIFIFAPCGIDFIRRKTENKNVVDIMEFFLFSILVILLSVNCLKYIGDKMYKKTEEINLLISYVQENIKEDEKLYVYPQAKRAFEFKNGYNSTKIGNVAQDNIIYGKERNEWNENILGNELLTILENKKTYLIFQHYLVGIDKGLSVLRNYGTLTEIMDVYDTPLYYFELSENKEREY